MVKPFVRFGYADRRLVLKDKRRVQSFVRDFVKNETGVSCQLQYVFCSDEYLYTMNGSFLNHHDYTDIITFDLSVDPKSLIEGEIYISVDRVAANAGELGVSFTQEILRVIFHGALHLCGYSDKKKSEKLQMRAKEDQYLKLFGAL